MHQRYGPFTEMPTAPSNRTYLVGLALIASLGGFLFGYDIAVISSTTGLVKGKFSLGLHSVTKAFI